MAWTGGVTRATGDLISATIWNNHMGAAGDLAFLSTHTHTGVAGDGSSSLGPLVLADYTDAAAPAAPGAGKTRFYTTAGRLRYRPGAAGADTLVPQAHADLSSVTSDQHHAQAHAAEHGTGATDPFANTLVLEAIGKRLQTTTGPTTLLMGAVADGEFLKRSGTGIVSGVPGGVDFQQFTSSGTWTKPAGKEIVLVVAIGAGAGAGGGQGAAAPARRYGGGGGGGGAYTFGLFDIDALGATEGVTIGAGGPGGAGGATANGSPGTAGGNSSFGSWLTAYGGGAGRGGLASYGGGPAGGGAGTADVGQDAGTTAHGNGGPPYWQSVTIGTALGGGGAKGGSGCAEFGGGGGGGGTGGGGSTGGLGGSSLRGGAGGGGGGGVYDGYPHDPGGAGGSIRSYAQGGGGTAGAAGGGAGGAGAANTSGNPASGGGGGGGNSGGTGGVGGAGGAPGGGGGGGGGGTSTGGAGGVGGRGEVRVWSW